MKQDFADYFQWQLKQQFSHHYFKFQNAFNVLNKEMFETKNIQKWKGDEHETR